MTEIRRHIMLALVAVTLCATAGAEPLVLENDFVRIAFSEAGSITELIDRAAGTDHAATAGDRSFCAVVLDDGTRLVCTELEREGARVRASFERPGIALSYLVEEREGYFVLTLAEVVGDGVAEVRLLNLATAGLPRRTLRMNAAFNDDFVAGAFALDLPIDCRPIPQSIEGARPINLVTATCYSRIGPLAGNRVAVYGCPYPEIEGLVARIEQQNGLPHPVYEGVWTKLSPEVRKSYLFLHDLSEDNADRAIGYALRGGFDMVMINMSCWSASGGHSEINTRYFPRGMEGFRDVCERIHAAGLKVALHVAACCAITENDSFVTPVPAPGLIKDASVPLAAAVGPAETFIPLAAPPVGFPEERASAGDDGLDVQIGDEIVTYTSLQTEAPFGLVGCTRGAYGTVASAHEAGADARHLRRYFGRFVYDLHSEVGDYYTSRLAEMCDAVNADMLYMDFSKYGSDEWFHGAEIQRAVYAKLQNKDVFMQAGRTWHGSWHLMSRTASADGYADWRGYLNSRLGGLANDLDHRFVNLPREVGWYGLHGAYGWLPLDAFRYIRDKGLGFDAPLSLSSRVAWLDEHPRGADLLDISRRCETAHVERRLTEEQLAQCRELDADYLLELVSDDAVRLQRVSYDPVREVSGEAGRLTLTIESESAEPVPFELDLRLVKVGGAGAAYGDVVAEVEEFEDVSGHSEAWLGPDCSHRWWAEEGKTGEQCLVYESTNASATTRGYSGITRDFAEPISVSEHAAVGFWVRGDGKGEWIKFQLRDADGGLAAYPVQVTFDGWAYIEIDRPNPDRGLDFSRIVGITIYYQQVPPETTCTIALDGIRALGSTSPRGLSGAAMTLRGEPVALPARGEHWLTAVLSPDGSAHLLGRGGAHLADTPPSTEGARLMPGSNEIVLTYEPRDGTSDFEARVMRAMP